MENMQKQSMQAAMLKDIHNQRLGSLSSSSAASEKSKSHSDLSSIELGKLLKPAIQIKLRSYNLFSSRFKRPRRRSYPIAIRSNSPKFMPYFALGLITCYGFIAILRRIRKVEMSTWNPNGSPNETRFSKTSKCSNKLNMYFVSSMFCTLSILYYKL